jgi:hypothetical protein
MKQGFLWFDNDPKKTMESKLAEAMNRYKTKFGAAPTVCYVNPSDVDASLQNHGKVKLVGTIAVLPHHLWLEIDN